MFLKYIGNLDLSQKWIMFGPMTPDEAMEVILQLSVAVGILLAALTFMYIRLGRPVEGEADDVGTIFVGLTGGICSGKSTMRETFASMEGVEVVDADKIGHAVYPAVIDDLVAAFGTDILTVPDAKGADRNVDRAKLGPLVFKNPANMSILQNIMWPEIRRRIQTALDEAKGRHVRMVVVEAAVMVEAEWTDMFHFVVVVTVSPEVAIQRLMQRNKLTEEHATSRLKSQMTNEERIKKADVVVENTVSMDQLQERARSVFGELVVLAARRNSKAVHGEEEEEEIPADTNSKKHR